MPEYAYSMYKVSKTYPGGKQVLKDISLSYFYGAKIGVIGLNGAGKSTLLRIMAGLEKEFSGEATPGPGRTIGFLPQEPILDDSKTVKENIEGALSETIGALNRFEEISLALADPDLDPDKMEELINEQASVQDIIDSQNGWEIEHTLEIAMDALRCPPGDQIAANLSGGERRRVALCRLLLQKPDILLLDEPTNHLDAESILWLEQHLQRYEGTVIAVTHDRYFLDNIAEWILELDRGHGIPWKGNYSSWLEQKQKRLADEERQEEKRIKTLARELEWIQMSP
ncbi:MAG: ATP-binding cassette domain-containing protein, partial [SAR324 cluster bacterium]|nr:ATP-binding cassette domain-containing protein [SAR324 cluster bacterium]